jgi:hypothetical protein
MVELLSDEEEETEYANDENFIGNDNCMKVAPE